MKNNIKTEFSLKYKLYDFDYLTLRSLLDDFIYAINFYLKDRKNLKIVDVGCGVKPYFPLFQDKVREYIGVDIIKNDNVDIVAPGEKLPLDDNSFDVALSTQVLEHTRGFQMAIDEIYRILKTDGVAFFSVPGVWEIHGAPHDYWRFTQYGLKEIFKNFKQIEIINNGGAVLCFFQICNIYLNKLTRIPIIRFLILLIIIINNFLGWNLDKLAGKYDFFVINYLVVVKK